MGEGTHRYGKMEWVFYIIILPLLFTALLSGVILQFLGFDITGKIAASFKSLTGSHQVVQSASSKSSVSTKQLQDQVKSLQQTKQQLEDSLAQKNSQIDSMQKQINSFKNGTTSNGTGGSSSPIGSGPASSGPSGNSGTGNAGASGGDSYTGSDPLQAQADIYSQMSAAKAAAILGNISITQARAVLSKMTSDQEAAILQKMDPVVAGKILSAQ